MATLIQGKGCLPEWFDLSAYDDLEHLSSVELYQEVWARAHFASAWVFPAQKMQQKGTPHISSDTLNRALDLIKGNLPEIEYFTIHDLRRTTRTHLAELGVKRDVAEMCLNYVIKGVEGVYNQYTYFNERSEALALWAETLCNLINPPRN